MIQGFWSRKARPQTPSPSGVPATIEISTLRSRGTSSPNPAAKRSRPVAGSSKKTDVARKSPLEKAASHTLTYNSSGDLAYRIASLVALSAANVRARLVSKILELPAAFLPFSRPNHAGATPKRTLGRVLNHDSK